MLTFLLAAAEGGGNPLDFNPVSYIVALVVFLIFFGVLRVAVWPKITGALAERERKILAEIDAAEKARGDAEAAKAKFERDLAAARDESAKMIAQARSDAQRLAEELKARSEADLQDRLAKANAEIDSAKRAAVAELHAHASDLATMMAGKILQREINANDQQRLVEESLAELAGRRN